MSLTMSRHFNESEFQLLETRCIRTKYTWSIFYSVCDVYYLGETDLFR